MARAHLSVRPTRLLAGVVAACAALAIPAVNAAPAANAASAANAVPAVAGPSGVGAWSAAVENAATSRLLWSRDLNTERPMASITKVMTALVVMRAGHLNQQITVPSAVVAYVREWDASNAGLRPGDKLTARQLLYGLLLPSGADAAYTLAEAYGPGITAFIAKMNATARLLGMTRTHFSTFDGLPWPTPYSNYSTAANLLTLGRDAMQSAAFRSGSPPDPDTTPTCGTTSTRCSATIPAQSASSPDTPGPPGSACCSRPPGTATPSSASRCTAPVPSTPSTEPTPLAS